MNSMKKRFLLPVIIISFLFLVGTAFLIQGCGGGSLSDSSSTGTVGISLSYPQDDKSSSSSEDEYVSYYLIDIYEATESSEGETVATPSPAPTPAPEGYVWVQSVPTTRVDYPETTATIFGVPTGEKLLTIRGYDEENELVNYGESIIEVSAGENDPVTVTVTPWGTPSPTPTCSPSPSPSPMLPTGYTFSTKWGTAGSGDTEFQLPYGIANGSIFVADSQNDRIKKYDEGGNLQTIWYGDMGTGVSFFYPSGVTTDPDGNIYVADSYNYIIQKMDSDGVVTTYWGTLGSSGTGNGEFDLPADVALDSDGNVYVADTLNHRIQKLDPSGSFITKWGKNIGDGSAGSGNGEFNNPWGITVDSNNYVYVADSGNNRVQKFDSEGNFITKWGVSGTGDGEFYFPSGVAVGPNGLIYVVEADNNRFQIFKPDGTFVVRYGGPGTGSDNGQFNYPYGIAVDSNGNVYIADTYNNRIQKFEPQY